MPLLRYQYRSFEFHRHTSKSNVSDTFQGNSRFTVVTNYSYISKACSWNSSLVFYNLERRRRSWTNWTGNRHRGSVQFPNVWLHTRQDSQI